MPGAYIGRFVGDCNLEFGGDLDLVRLWGGALSPDAMAAAATRELSPDGAPLPFPGVPLPAAAPPTTIAAGSGARGAPVGPGQPGAVRDRARRRCVLRPAKRRVKPERRTVVRVRVKLRGRPARATRVVAKRPQRARVLAAARTGKKGWARLVFNSSRLARVRISAPRASPCSPVYIKVARSR